MSDDGTIMLVCGLPVWDRFGHGTVAHTPFYHPQSGLTLMRTTREAAEHYCLRGGCYVAPPGIAGCGPLMAQERKRFNVSGAKRTSHKRPLGGKRAGAGRWGSGPLQCTVCQHPERGRIDYLIASGASMQSVGEQFGLAKQRLSDHFKKHVSERFKQMCSAQHLASFEDMLKNATEANIEAVDLCNLLIKGHMQRWAANLESGSDTMMNLHANRVGVILELRSRITLELMPESRTTINNTWLVRDAAALVDMLKGNPDAVARIERWYEDRLDNAKLLEHAEIEGSAD